MNLTIHNGDCLEKLKIIPSGSIHCCVTSPPYWGLRDYGQPGQIGLEKTPEEYVAKMVAVFTEVYRVLRDDGTLWLNLGSTYSGAGYSNNKNTGGARREDGGKQKHSYVSRDKRPTQSHSDVPACGIGGTALSNSPAAGRACPDCGGELTACSLNHHDRTAHTSQQSEQFEPQPSRTIHDSGHLDCAPSPHCASPLSAHPSTIVSSCERAPGASCREEKASERQLKSLTFGGNAQASEGKTACTSGIAQTDHPSIYRRSDTAFVCMACGYSTRMLPEFKPKDMIPIPWLVALALQAAGWYLRSDIIWSKPNPMPESVTDRPTKAHEYIFLLTKSERYFYDHEAVKEPCNSGPSDIKKMVEKKDRIDAKHFHTDAGELAAANHRTNVGQKRGVGDPTGRNRRSVWTVGSAVYDGAHFATYPPDLIKPCIMAGTSARGCCSVCGAPYERVFERTNEVDASAKGSRFDTGKTGSRDGGDRTQTGERFIKKAVGWQPTCECVDAQIVPCTVLDPFGGSGTTGEVALELGRRAVLIELNPQYIPLIEKRTNITPGLPI